MHTVIPNSAHNCVIVLSVWHCLDLHLMHVHFCILFQKDVHIYTIRTSLSYIFEGIYIVAQDIKHWEAHQYEDWQTTCPTTGVEYAWDTHKWSGNVQKRCMVCSARGCVPLADPPVSLHLRCLKHVHHFQDHTMTCGPMAVLAVQSWRDSQYWCYIEL